MAITIVRAAAEDADGILRCLRTAFAPYQGQYTPAAYEDTVMTPEGVRERLQTMTVLVARSDTGEIIGTIGAKIHAAEGHLRGMAVLPSWQGRGIADRLLAAIEGELIAAGCSVATLDTTAPLTRAAKFYERSGYVRSGAVSDFFGMPLYGYRKRLRAA